MFNQKTTNMLFICGGIFLFITFFIGAPLQALEKINLAQIVQSFQSKPSEKTIEKPTSTGAFEQELGGTDSKKIRLIVWKGALDIFKQNPLIGTGVETFAFAYYKVKPKEHNLTSEWDFLYNKAHNEYLNYLATTGIVGLGSYLLFIVWFYVYTLKHVLFVKRSEEDVQKLHPLALLFATALLSAHLSILISNFFGFSVVIVNLYLFLIPVLVFDLLAVKNPKSIIYIQLNNSHEAKPVSSLPVLTALTVAFLVWFSLEIILLRYWSADVDYAKGYNANRSQEYNQALEPLENAIAQRPDEPIYKDELAVTLSVQALLASKQQLATMAAELAESAKHFSDENIARHPNNLLFYKSRTKIMYTLSQIDPVYISEAVSAIKKAAELAPTDAKILYNQALLQNATEDRSSAINALKKSIDVKPNYRDSYILLAQILINIAKEEKSFQKAQDLKQEARNYLNFSLTNIDGNDKEAKKLLEELK